MKFRKLLKYAGLYSCVGFGHLFKPQGIPILAYHSIDSSNSNLSILPEIFDKQMRYLQEEGFRLISLEQLMSEEHSKKSVHEKTLVLTFDDGLKNFHKNAWPVLKRYSFTATIFVPTDFIEQESRWYADYDLKPFPMLNWQELRELAKNGIDIQSHGCSHRKLTHLTPSEIEREVNDSKKVLEKGLKKAVDFFCYPFGEVNLNIIQAVRNAGYKGALCMKQGLYKINDNPYLMKRQSLDYISILDTWTALLSIKACTQGTFAWYVRAKRKLKGS